MTGRLTQSAVSVIFTGALVLALANPVRGQGSETGPGNPTILKAIQNLQNSVNALQTAVNNQQTTLTTLQNTVSNIATNGTTSKLRRYYLTKDRSFDGSQALAACSVGFHMASLWEIFDTSNLQYDTNLGFTAADSGQGPPDFHTGPSFTIGWIRTGFEADNSDNPGTANCSGWTTNAPAASGTEAALNSSWFSAAFPQPIAPWINTTFGCDNHNRVWCADNYR